MRLPQVEIRQAESLGRNNIAAVGALASTKGGYATAQANMLQHLGKVGGEFIRREELSLRDTAMTNAANSESQYTEKDGAKEFFTGQELEGRVKNIELYNIGADQNGKEIKTYKKSIPAYKVYPQLLNNKLTGDMDVYAKTIPNPIDRKAFIESRSVDIGNKVRGATLAAAREQYVVLRTESDARRDAALANGDIAAANIEAEKFDGSDFEIKERLTENAQKMEIWTGDRLIQIEDKGGIRNMLNRLTDKNYKKKGGPLPERPNIDLQNRLRSKLASLEIKKGATSKIYKEELRQKAQDFIKAQQNGDLKSSEEVDAMMGALNDVDLQAMAINVRRANKMSTFVDFMNKYPAVHHVPMINEFLDTIAKGDKRDAFKATLLNKSAEIAKRQENDLTGFYQEQNESSAPKPGDKNFFAKSLASSKLAAEQYKRNALPLSDRVASDYSRQFQSATIQAKQKFIESVLPQIPNKGDRDALFTQIDKKGGGNLNVYADIIERGERQLIKDIDEGRKLRNDPKLKLIPIGSDKIINKELYQVFRLESERRQYVEAVKDYYAKTANDEGEYERLTPNKTRLSTAIEAVIGNIVKYDNRNFLLPNNEINASGLDNWITNLDYKYISQLGGVENMTDKATLQAVRDGDFKLYPSLTRGTYLLKDAEGKYLMKENPKEGESFLFEFKYDKYAPERRVMTFREWKQGGYL